MNLHIAVAIATYRRPRELARLFASLPGPESGIAHTIVVDNARDAETRGLVERRAGGHYLAPGKNLGCGGGLRLAEEAAGRLAGQCLTHLLVLDDDAVVSAEAVDELVRTMEEKHAGVAYPLVTAADGHVGWLPGLANRAQHRLKSQHFSLDRYRAVLGDTVADFVWAQGICLLVKREAMEQCGLHRDDFWVRGEDLEFSLRLTARFRGILVTRACVQHLPPESQTGTDRVAEYLKHCALVQNNAYIMLRLPHGRRVIGSLPGTLRHLFRTWGWSASADAWRAIWRGGILGQPAGRGRGATFLTRYQALAAGIDAGAPG